MDKELLFKIMDSAINGKILPNDLAEKIDEELLNCLKEQTFLPFLYPIFNYEKFESYYLKSFAIHEQFNFIKEKVKSVLTEASIKHIFLKGSVIKQLYPDENLRSLGDIDFLVEEMNLLKARSCFLKAGFELSNVQENETLMTYNGILIELHNALFTNDSVGSKFFCDPFSHAKLIEGLTYTLEDNYNYLYIITHYAKHLSAGAGLRPLCDIYLMSKKLNLDWNYINEQLKILKLDKFFNTVLNELDIIFGYNEIKYTKNEYAQKLIDYSISSGIHGYGKEGDNIGNRIKNNSKGNKFIFLWKRLFIPIKYLFLRYPWTKSIILIPFGYVYRFFELIITRRDKFKEALNYKDQGDYFLDKIGLDYKNL